MVHVCLHIENDTPNMDTTICIRRKDETAMDRRKLISSVVVIVILLFILSCKHKVNH